MGTPRGEAQHAYDKFNGSTDENSVTRNLKFFKFFVYKLGFSFVIDDY